jgi:hypothetical protein
VKSYPGPPMTLGNARCRQIEAMNARLVRRLKALEAPEDGRKGPTRGRRGSSASIESAELLMATGKPQHSAPSARAVTRNMRLVSAAFSGYRSAQEGRQSIPKHLANYCTGSGVELE